MTGGIKFRSDFDVELVESCGSDELIAMAARVSTTGSDYTSASGGVGPLIHFLMKNRHGSPFEHGTIIFRISAPIFVWREFMRHRIGVSYNEQSGRYMEMEPVFYLPMLERPLVQTGKAGAYIFEEGTQEQWMAAKENLKMAYNYAWESYQLLLEQGIAREVARMGLPLAIYSSAYVTMNPRSLMHFLSLRTISPDSTFPSFPQWEIAQVGDRMERIFEMLFPYTRNSFNHFGRVCP